MSHQKMTVPLSIKGLNSREFSGYGSVFGNEDLGGDIVMSGAFKNSLSEHTRKGTLPQMCWMHDLASICGKWTEMSEDENGLVVKGVLADTQLGNEIHTLLKMDAVRGLSIGYQPTETDWSDDGVRLIKQAELWEVSVVSLPMNPLAQVEHVKSRLSARGEYVPTRREFEWTLRDAGYSQKVAKTILSRVFGPDVTERDVSEVPQDAEVSDDEAVKAALLLSEKLTAATVCNKIQRKRY